MSYENDKIAKFIIETETNAILNSLDNLIDRYIYIVGTVSDLIEADDEKKKEKITNYIQNKIIEDLGKSDIFEEFNSIFGAK